MSMTSNGRCLGKNVKKHRESEEVFMESIVFKFFEALFNAVRVLLFCGLMAGVLSGLQKSAFQSKQIGLINMLHVKQQLVGKTR